MKIKAAVVSTMSLILVLVGLVFGLFEARLCFSICEACNNDQLGPCYFLFLFVGIIFVVTGASLFNNYRDLRKIELNMAEKSKEKK